MRLSDRVRKIERAMRPCFVDREYKKLRDRYGEEAINRGYAWVERQILGEAERLGLTVIDDGWAPSFTVEELRARVEGVAWTELDERAAEAEARRSAYIKAHKVTKAPDWFLPLWPRTKPHEISTLHVAYLIETDPEARRLYLEEQEAVEQIAAGYGSNDRR